jgi:hypothetical protein
VNNPSIILCPALFWLSSALYERAGTAFPRDIPRKSCSWYNILILFRRTGIHIVFFILSCTVQKEYYSYLHCAGKNNILSAQCRKE